MRILHIVRTLDPAAGGPPYVAARLAAAQAELGHDVHLAYYEDSAPAAGDPAVGRIPSADRLCLHPMPPPGRWEPLTALSARRRMRSAIPAFDLVHLHEMWHPLLWTAAGIAWKFAVPYVVTPHGMLDPWSLRQKPWKKRIALALGWRKVLDRAAFLHVLNADEDRLMAPLGLTCRAEIIPNGVSIEKSSPAVGDDFFQATYGFSGQRSVLFLGRLHFKKGLDYLGAAFEVLHRSLPDVRLVVAGPDAGAEQQFHHQITSAGLDTHVHFVGPLYGERKLAALRRRVVLLPAKSSGRFQHCRSGGDGQPDSRDHLR